MKVIVLGAAGMLGSTIYRVLGAVEGIEVVGTVRSDRSAAMVPTISGGRLRIEPDVTDADAQIRLLSEESPDVLINCIGIIKQLTTAKDPIIALTVNTFLPHRLERLCRLSGTRLIHYSTDCIFDGSRGGYVETDESDAKDLYGKSKFLGEVAGPSCITLRTSIIGHELGSAYSLIDWFLAQEGQIKGFTGAIFSGLPTIAHAWLLRDVVLPAPKLCGLYHVSANPISKFDLLSLVAKTYGKDITIEPSDTLKIDRSLDSSRFRAVTGYVPPDWNNLISAMYDTRL